MGSFAGDWPDKGFPPLTDRGLHLRFWKLVLGPRNDGAGRRLSIFSTTLNSPTIFTPKTVRNGSTIISTKRILCSIGKGKRNWSYSRRLGMHVRKKKKNDKTWIYLMHDPRSGYYKVGQSVRPWRQRDSAVGRRPRSRRSRPRLTPCPSRCAGSGPVPATPWRAVPVLRSAPRACSAAVRSAGRCGCRRQRPECRPHGGLAGCQGPRDAAAPAAGDSPRRSASHRPDSWNRCDWSGLERSSMMDITSPDPLNAAGSAARRASTRVHQGVRHSTEPAPAPVRYDAAGWHSAAAHHHGVSGLATSSSRCRTT